MTQKIIDLGWANGWTDRPAIVVACRAAKHDCDQETTGRCVRRISCPDCGYTYQVDSSD